MAVFCSPGSGNAQPSGTLVAWGYGDYVPEGLSNIIAVAAGYEHTLALKADGGMVAWGYNGSGRATIPEGLTNVVLMAAGGAHNLVVRSGGVLATWGNNDYGQTNIPTGLTNALAVAAGTSHSLVIKPDRTVAAWGRNDNGQANVPDGLNNVVAIATQESSNLALRSNGTVVAWGLNNAGQRNVPVGLSNVVAIAAGGGHMLALRGNGTVVAWGRNTDGQTNVPSGLTDVVAIAAGSTHSAALRSDGTVIAWGDNYFEQTNVPAAVGPIAAITANSRRTLAVRGNPVNILLGPTNQVAGSGWDVAFGVKALGYQPLNYRWFFNETNLIAGATNEVLRLFNVQHSEAGTYKVVVENAYAALTSSPATLGVVDLPPTILAQPASQAFWPGFTIDLTVGTSGSLPMAYQWYANGSSLGLGATDATLRLPNIQPSQAGTYSVIISNVAGVATSSPATLTLVASNTVPILSEVLLRSAISSGPMPVTFACDGTIVLSNTLIIGQNTVLDGSGHQVAISGNNAVRVFQVNPGTSLALANLTIANGMSDRGAGVFNAGGKLALENATFVNNAAIGPTGATYSGNPGSNGYGGAVYNTGIMVAMNSSFVSNSVAGGSGSTSPTLGVGSSGGDGWGGAIGNYGSLHLTGCLLANNTAIGGMGGFGAVGAYGIPGGNGSPGGNGGSGNGGAIFNQGTAVLINSSLALNSGVGGQGGAGGSGGPPLMEYVSSGSGGHGGVGGSGCGAVCDLNGQFYLTNCTLALNQAISGAGGAGGPPGYYPYPGVPRLGLPGSDGASGVPGSGFVTPGAVAFNTLLASNSPTNGAGTILDAGHNLSSDESIPLAGPGSVINTDPKLGPLANNGGPTFTMALLSGSPAINAGANPGAPATDQRGAPRSQGGAPDMGAFEYQELPIFANASIQNATNCQMLMFGLLPERPFDVLVSTNLLNWSVLTNLTADVNGQYQFLDPVTADNPTRFYRIQLRTP